MEPPGVDEKTVKGLGSQMSAPAIQNGIDRNLHHLTGPAHSGVSAVAKRPSEADAEAGGQWLADAKAGGQRPADVEGEGQRSEGQQASESKSGGPRPVESEPELEDQ